MVCSGCVGSTYIANNSVTSGKIGNGQVHNADIGGNAVTGSKISDTDGVRSVDIVNAEIKPKVHQVLGSVAWIEPGDFGSYDANCPAGEILSGGGFDSSPFVSVSSNAPSSKMLHIYISCLAHQIRVVG